MYFDFERWGVGGIGILLAPQLFQNSIAVGCLVGGKDYDCRTPSIRSLRMEGISDPSGITIAACCDRRCGRKIETQDALNHHATWVLKGVLALDTAAIGESAGDREG